MTISRRHWLKGPAAGALVLLGTPLRALARRLVAFGGYRPGTIVIITHRRELFFVLGGGRADNPMGAAALGLNRGNYGIHGTNNPSSVGRFVSQGCIRMYNSDIPDLYRRVPIGTPVVGLH